MENILEYVKEKWKQLTAFSKKEELKQQLWEEILYRYSEQHRHYHNLTHLGFLFTLCDKYLDKIENPAVVGFAIIYHDIVYDTYRSDNEALSADIAEAHLTQLNINQKLLKNIKEFIIASKDHVIAEGASLKEDLAIFLDFDMAILGSEEEYYKLYSDNIRQEYAKYPDDLYKPGRKLALQKMLAVDHIFHSPIFKEDLETAARENIQKEINLL
jgi:predicted metal-dependent HD superfamily phosphohydrolase